MAVIQAPVANVTYTVNGHSYTSGQDGRFSVSDAADLALLKAKGLMEYAAPVIPPSSGGTPRSGRVTLDMD